MDSFLLVSASIVLLFIVRHLLLRRTASNLPLPPGPKPWPLFGNLRDLGPIPHHSIAAWARVYGPLIYLRLGLVDVVVAASASVASQFLKFNDTNFSSRPQNSGTKYLAYEYQDMVFAPYGPRWRMLRRISSVHLFSGKAVDDFRHVRREEAAVLIRTLANTGSKAADLGLLLNVFTANTLGRMILGRRLLGDGNGDGNADTFQTMVMELMVLAGVFNIGDYIPALEFLDLQGVAGKMKNLHKRFYSFLRSVIEEHEQMGGREQCRDMLSTLLALKEEDDDEGLKLTDTEIKALLLNMFTAGTEPAVITVEWAMAELIKSHRVLALLREELDSVVGSDRLVTELDLPKLTYLQAVIKETFRLHPATPLSVPRIAAESCQIDGYHIPRGCTLLVNIWAIGRDPDEWVSPLEFRPERFLPGGEKHHVNVYGNHFELIPFGAGRRICAGMRLGLRMVRLLTAILVHGFNWDLLEGEKAEELNMTESSSMTLQRSDPLMLHPRRRLNPEAYSLPSC